MTKKKVEINHKGQVVIDGVEYTLKAEKGKIKDGHIHGDRWIFTDFDKETLDGDIDFIIKNIELMITKEELLREIISGYPLDTINAIKKSIQRGEPITRTEGCITFNFGKKELMTLVG